MSKQMFRDFVVATKRPEPFKRAEQTETRRSEEEVFVTGDKVGRRSWGKFITSVFFLLVVSYGFFELSSFLSSATVTITPVNEKISLDDVFVAVKTMDDEEDGVLFKTMKIEETEALPIVAEKSEMVSKKSSGKIIVYNNFSTNEQRLITGTRFESPEGYIYKIDSAISVPGKKIVGGKSVPGSLEVTVYASEPGSEYNISASDFTIPGLKGGPRYNDVYARGVGPMSGGYVGEVKIISPDDIAFARKKLESSLKQKLLTKARKQIPTDHLAYDDLMFFRYTDNGSELGTRSEGNRVLLTMKGELKVAIFDSNQLAASFAKRKIPDIKNSDVHSDKLNLLQVELVGKSDSLDIEKENSFSFKVSGNAKIVWNIDTDSFKDNLAGLNKNQYEEVFQRFPMVEKAETVFSPSWSSKFPDNASKIEVNIQEN